MFPINQEKKVELNDPLIVSQYQDLLFHDEPILFTGLNWLGARVLGSSVDEDYDLGVARYFHVVISAKLYHDFLERKISYRGIIDSLGIVYIVDIALSDNDHTIYLVNKQQIPTDLLPTYNSYCPKFAHQPAIVYSLKYKGILAEEHIAEIEDVNNSQEYFEDLLLGIKTPGIDIVSKPYVHTTKLAASFEMNFLIKINIGNQLDVFSNQDKYLQYIHQYLDYCTNNLDGEIEVFKELDFKKYPHLRNLYEKYKQLYLDHNIEFKEDYNKTFINTIKDSASIVENITKNIGKNYSSIEFYNKVDKIDNYICIFDEKYANNIEKMNRVIEEYSPEYDIELEYREYTIHIYQFSTKTNKGRAYIEENDNRFCVAITVETKENLEGTKYTESLAEGRIIHVLGKTTRKNGKYTRMDIKMSE